MFQKNSINKKNGRAQHDKFHGAIHHFGTIISGINLNKND